MERPSNADYSFKFFTSKLNTSPSASPIISKHSRHKTPATDPIFRAPINIKIRSSLKNRSAKPSAQNLNLLGQNTEYKTSRPFNDDNIETTKKVYTMDDCSPVGSLRSYLVACYPAIDHLEIIADYINQRKIGHPSKNDLNSLIYARSIESDIINDNQLLDKDKVCDIIKHTIQAVRMHIQKYDELENCEFLYELLRVFVIIMEKSLREKFQLFNLLNKKNSDAQSEISLQIEAQCKPLHEKINIIKEEYENRMRYIAQKNDEEIVYI